MSRRAPDVRRINMLSEYRDPDTDAGGTQGFWRSLSEADDFIREHDRAAELECRCDELTQLVEQIKQLHVKVVAYGPTPYCLECSHAGVYSTRTQWPCPTMKLIEGNT